MMAPQRSIQPNGSPAHDSPSDVPPNEASYTLWSDRNRAGSHNNSYLLCLTMKIVCEGTVDRAFAIRVPFGHLDAATTPIRADGAGA